MPKSKMISVRLTPYQINLIRRLAEENDSTQSQIIRQVLHRWLQAQSRDYQQGIR